MATTLRTSGITMGSSTLDVSGSAPSFTARAWVNFNGTGTVAIRSSGNVTSITDNNTGDYTVNITTALPDANFSGVVSSSWEATANNNVSLSGPSNNSAKTTTTFGCIAVNPNSNARIDSVFTMVAIFR